MLTTTERFSTECRETKTKIISTNESEGKYPEKPVRVRSKEKKTA